MPSNPPSPSEFMLFCDEQADKNLFLMLQSINAELALIPRPNIVVYPSAQAAGALSAILNAIKPLHQDDRPDWVFCYSGRPVLVVELTQHAYTGDNGLQRFARFAAAAENGVSFVYFGPLSRVRDDELDGAGVANPRRLTSDVFLGMEQLSKIFGVLQGFLPWATNAAGLPKSVPYNASSQEIQAVYGDLAATVATCLFEAPLPPDGSPLRHPKLDALQRQTARLAEVVNTRTSEVRLRVPRVDLEAMVLAPPALHTRMGGYFSRGKPDKQLAEFALLSARPMYVQWPNGIVSAASSAEMKNLVASIGKLPRFRGDSLVYYSGYKWRSDPHAGVLVNLDYRICRSNQGERQKGIVMFYPRVSLVPSSPPAQRLASCANDQILLQLFVNRYGATGQARHAATLASPNPFGTWSNKTKQARLLRKYADVVVLNDAIILGDSLKDVVSPP